VFGVYTRLPRFTTESPTGLNISLRILQALDQALVLNLGMVALIIQVTDMNFLTSIQEMLVSGIQVVKTGLSRMSPSR